MQRIQQVSRGTERFFFGRDGLFPYRTIGIIRIDQAQVIRCYGHTEQFERLVHPLFLFGGQGNVFTQLFQVDDPVPYLPFPVVPLLIGHLGEQLFSSAFFHMFFLLITKHIVR
jgi:hypothetical protein